MNALAPLSYEEQKACGLRRRNGARPLSKLTGKHYTCINYHLAGISGLDIAKEMGLSPAWVSMVLTDPLAQEVIQQRFLELDQELRALYPQMVQVLRDTSAREQFIPEARAVEGGGNIVPNSPEVRLAAVEKFFRSQGKYANKEAGRGPITAEDIVKEMLAQAAPGETLKVGLEVSRQSGLEPASHFELTESEQAGVGQRRRVEWQNET